MKAKRIHITQRRFFAPLLIAPIALFTYMLFYQQTWILEWFIKIGTGLGLLITAIVVFTPLGNKRLAPDGNLKKRLSTPRWLAYIVGFQCSFYAFYYGMNVLLFRYMPVHTTADTTTFLSSLQALLIHWWGYPWTLIAPLTLSYAIMAYREKERATIPGLVYPLFKNNEYHAVTYIAQLFGRNSATLMLAISIAMVAMMVAKVMSNDHIMPLSTGLTSAAQISVLILFAYTFTPPYRRHLKALLSRKRHPGFGLFIGALMLGLLLMFFNSLMQAVVGPHRQAFPVVLTTLYHMPIQLLWHLLSAGWWLGVIPIASVFFGYYSRGYCARTLLLAILLPIGGLALVTWGLQHAGIMLPTLSTTAGLLILLLGLACMLLFLTQKRTLSLFSQLEMADRDKPKPRDYHPYLRRSVQLSFGVIYLYVPTGLAVVCLVTVIIGGVGIVLFIAALIGLMLRLKYLNKMKPAEVLPSATRQLESGQPER